METGDILRAEKIAEAQAIQAELATIVEKYGMHAFIAFYCKDLKEGEDDQYGAAAKLGCRVCAMKSLGFGLQVSSQEDLAIIALAMKQTETTEVIHATPFDPQQTH